MKKIRIIARLDIKGPNVIKGVHLECLRVVGNPDEMAKKYYEQGADELAYMDVVASLYGRNNLVEIVEKASEHIFIPLTVGGGIRSLEDISRLLRAGADKVAINSWIIQHPDFVNEAAKTFGSQCIVGSIEAKKRSHDHWEALYNNGRELSGRDAIAWAKELVDRGVGELLITSVDQEGTGKGFDIDLISRIAPLVDVPVIASGGAGRLEDIRRVVDEGSADAVALARVLHFDQMAVPDVRKYLRRADVGVAKAV